MLSVTSERCKSSNTVAAGPTDFVSSFELRYLMSKSNDDSELMEAVKQFLGKLVGYDKQSEYVCQVNMAQLLGTICKQLKKSAFK